MEETPSIAAELEVGDGPDNGWVAADRSCWAMAAWHILWICPAGEHL